jgi:hypothetical protein
MTSNMVSDAIAVKELPASSDAAVTIPVLPPPMIAATQGGSSPSETTNTAPAIELSAEKYHPPMQHYPYQAPWISMANPGHVPTLAYHSMYPAHNVPYNILPNINLGNHLNMNQANQAIW